MSCTAPIRLQRLNAMLPADLRVRAVEGWQDDRPRQHPIQPPIRLQPPNMMRFAGLRTVRDPAAGLETPVQTGVNPGEAACWNRRLRWPLLHSELRLLGGTIGESLMTQHGKGSMKRQALPLQNAAIDESAK